MAQQSDSASSQQEATASYHGLSGSSPGAPAADDHAGTPLGPYRLLEPVRTWRHGTLYLARHPRLQRTVHVRVLEGAAAADPAVRAEFARFAQDLTRLAHPNVAGVVLEAALDEATPYLALENGPGLPLAGLGPRDWSGRQREGLYPNRRLGQALLDAARALAAIHAAGLVHGNLRPDVLRVDADGRTLLAGLGDEEATVPEAAPFAAPADLSLTAPRQRDLYALGASFFFVVTGQPPAANAVAVRQANPGVAQAVADVLARCLAADPSRRYASADDLAADLERILQTETVQAPWGLRVLLILEAFVAAFGGAALVALVAKLGFNYQEGDDPTFPELMAVFSPALLYWVGTEFLLGRTLLRRWQGYEVADLSGARAGRGRRWLRSVIKIGLLAGWCIGFGWFFGAAAEQKDPLALLLALFTWLPLLLAGLYGYSWFLLQQWRYLGEPLTGADAIEAMQRLPHDRLSGTRLVVRRALAAVPAPASEANRESDFGPFTDRLDQYNLGPCLGAGGMGTVYRGWDRALARPVALKVLNGSLQNGPASRERFEREARLAAQLNHANVAKVYGIGAAELGGRPYIAMELVQGQSLQERVRGQGPLPVAEAWGLVLQAAEALRAADALGIVHRDIKPSNLMVSPEGTLKVTDFGVSRQQEDEIALTGAGTVVGTPLYMAPEQATGKPVDGRSDMYGLGMTLHFLLTGRTAFAATNPMDLLSQQLAGPAKSLAGQVPGLTDRQAELIARMLAARPRDRFAHPTALLDALRTESPELAPAAPIYFRFADGVMHLISMAFLLAYLCLLLLLARFGFRTANWGAEVQSGRIWSWLPGVLLTWQCLASLITILAVVYRPPMQPFRPRDFRPPWGILAHLGNIAWGGLIGLLMIWPALQFANGLRVIRHDGRRLRLGRAALRFAAGYLFLLPWAALAFLPALSVEALALPIGIVNLVLLLASALVLLLHPQRRNLPDLVAGTRVVRVPPPVLCNHPSPLTQPLRRVRPALALVQASLAVLLLGGIWAGTVVWLQALHADQRAQRAQAKEQARVKSRQFLQEFEDEFMRKYDFSRIEARLRLIGGYFRSAVQRGRIPGPKNLAGAWSEECLNSPRGGKILVLWDADLTRQPELAGHRLLAYEETPDAAGKRYVLNQNGMTFYVGDQEFQTLLRAAGR